jgi:hypothetical protein
MRGSGLVVAVAVGAQAAVLAALAGLPAHGASALLGGAAVAAAGAAAAWPRLSRAGRAWLGMLALGGLGMTLGWWADLDFGSAAALVRTAPAAVAAGAWCGLAPLAGGAHVGRRAAHALAWMNAGMLLGGVLAMRLAHGRGGAGCGRARVALESLAMLLGMNAGGLAATRVAAGLAPALAVVTAHALMNAGMLAGMQLAELAWLRAAGREGPAVSPKVSGSTNVPERFARRSDAA